MEELQARHRKEQKDLQARVTQKKRNATKKTRKGVNDECERLERDLKQQQQAEIDTLNGSELVLEIEQLDISNPIANGNGESSSESGKKVSFPLSTKVEPPGETEQQGQHQRSKKPNRQKARLARRAAEQEEQTALAEDEAANQPDLREQEMTAMEQHKKKMGLTETFIRPDGHCLFSACAKGLPTEVVAKSGPFAEDYRNVRYATANFMLNHQSDFEAFLEEPFDGYVEKIKNTAEWGGQLELQAISKSYNATVNVLQADGRIEKFEPDHTGSEPTEIWLAYYRHSFGLGEHYNALYRI